MDYAARFKEELNYIKPWGIPDQLLVARITHDRILGNTAYEISEGECELDHIAREIRDSGGISEKKGMELEARIAKLIETRKSLLKIQEKAAYYSRKVARLRADSITTPEQYFS